METTITQILLCFATAAIGWAFSKLKTNREKRDNDLNFVNNSVAPLVKSITDLTEQNNEIVRKLVAEQDKNLKLLKEKGELLEEIEGLRKEVNELKRKLETFIKKQNKNEKDSNHTNGGITNK